MVTARQFFHLQELDQEISRLSSMLASVEEELEDHSEMDRLERDLEEAQASVQELSTNQRREELDANTFRQKMEAQQSKLYSGTVTNIREMEALEREVDGLRTENQRREERLLEVMLTLEEGQARVRQVEQQRNASKQHWSSRQKELTSQRRELQQNLESLDAGRGQSATALGDRDLSLYERLRASKGGLAVARVERGLCRGCLMALPTHQLQRARLGREPVLCDSCGRILYVS